MYSSDCFEQFLGFGNIAEVLAFSYRELDVMGLDTAPLLRLGLLVEIRIGSGIECAGCGASVLVSPRTLDDGIALFADCPQCGVYRLSVLESKRYQVEFSPLLTAARTALRCSGAIAELIPHALWSLGRSPLAGQSREVFACAGINGARNSEILRHLPTGKTPLLLVLGNAPRPEKLGAFSPDRVFLFSDLARIEDDEICLDASIIQNQLGMLPTLEKPAPKAIGRNSKIGDLIIKLKEELREYMQGNYSAVMQAERNNRIFDFPEIKQSDLARILGVERVYIKRALDADLELKALFASANNRKSTLAYGHKANF